MNTGQSFSDKALYAALVKDYNAQGGMAGRKIVPTVAVTDTGGTNWSTQFQAACQNFTEDHHVKAVLGYVFVFLDSFEQCLSSKQVPHLYGGYSPGDQLAQRQFPYLTSVAHPSMEVFHDTVLTGAVATGRLTTKSKLGVIVDSCGHSDRGFRHTSEPYLKREGISYETVYMSCSSGASDQAGVAAVQSAELQFASHGVNVVYIPNGIALLLFMENAEGQHYRPSYIAPGGGGALEALGAAPSEQMKNFHGYGWTPALDVAPSRQPYPRTAAQKKCLARLARQGVRPAQINDFVLTYVTCDSFSLYDQAITLIGGRTDARLITQALAQVMTKMRTASTYDGLLRLNATQRGGPGRYREEGWEGICSCIRYRGPVRATPAS